MQKKQDLVQNEPNNKYPKAIPYIIGNEFCERFCFYGMRAILTLYFVQILNYSEDNATEAFHLFAMFCYFTPILGAFIADSYWGKYKTILYISLVYVSGNILLSFASYITSEWASILGLVLIAVGTGGIKPCVSSFGGDQFNDNQMHLLSKFFALFYLSINLGSLLSTAITPMLRKDVTCFGKNSCYPLAFSLPALLMIVALILFLIGSNIYRKIPPAKGNIVCQFITCISYSLYKKFSNIFSKGEKPAHFLDYSIGKYSNHLIEDSKIVLSLLLLYVPLPIFWSLFDQQGSRWVLQAQHTSGALGFINYSVKPDQFSVINPVLIVIMIPLFEYLIYPMTDKLRLMRKPLQRMSVGGLLAALAFVTAAMFQIYIDKNTSTLPTTNYMKLNLLDLNSESVLLRNLELYRTPNNFSNNFNKSEMTLSFTGKSILETNNGSDLLRSNVHRYVNIGKIKSGNYTFNLTYLLENQIQSDQFNVELLEQTIQTMAFTLNPNNNRIQYKVFNDKGLNPFDTFSVHFYCNFRKYFELNEKLNRVTLQIKEPNAPLILHSFEVHNTLDLSDSEEYLMELNKVGYVLLLNGKQIAYFNGENGASYKVAIVCNSNQTFEVDYILVKKHVAISMFWQTIQYVIITASEIMLSVTGLEFSYSQAPTSMKSVVTAAWLFTTSLGNFFVVLITEYVHFESQVSSFFFFALLMAVDMLFFIVLAYWYKPQKQDKDYGLVQKN